MRHRIGLAAVATLAIVLGGCKTYALPLQKLSGKKICGAAACIPGNAGTTFHYTKRPYQPVVTETTTAKDAAAQIVGRMVRASDPWGGLLPPCSTDGTHSFDADDIQTRGNASGLATKYRREVAVEIDVGAAVEADLRALELMGVVSKGIPLDQARAKLTSAYSSVSDSTVIVDARYYTFGLTNEARDALLYQRTKPKCEAALKEPVVTAGKPDRRTLITDVGLVLFDASYSSNSTAQAVAALEAEFRTHGIPFDFSAEVDRRVKESIQQTLKGSFSVVSINRIDASAFEY